MEFVLGWLVAHSCSFTISSQHLNVSCDFCTTFIFPIPLPFLLSTFGPKMRCYGQFNLGGCTPYNYISHMRSKFATPILYAIDNFLNHHIFSTYTLIISFLYFFESFNHLHFVVFFLIQLCVYLIKNVMV